MQRMVADVLAAWRHAVRVRDDHREGTPEHEVAARVAEQLRLLYQQVLATETAPDAVREALAGIQLPERIPAEP